MCPQDPARQLTRHAVATIAYRGGKVLSGVPSEFAQFRAAETARTPVQILAHIGDLFDWALSIAQGKAAWHASQPGPWPDEVNRFFKTLAAFDERLASGAAISVPLEKLLQGPIADALTHIGQLALLRRLAGSPIRGENYFRAEIAAGRVGAEQALPAFEFD